MRPDPLDHIRYDDQLRIRCQEKSSSSGWCVLSVLNKSDILFYLHAYE